MYREDAEALDLIKDYLKLYTGKKVKGLGGGENKAKRLKEKRRERELLLN